ncbi:hypothetical protein C2845_PM07G21000 [Panicum miliaceum]|uniref:Uncharacterized protein n=1 Tax=Panicum miliaceum TaxID=4540 RepID=A0A3L6SHA6_PANMI|nr:hypothetical protein C2845_PM07G21000 [Panicum miliaceum]
MKGKLEMQRSTENYTPSDRHNESLDASFCLAWVREARAVALDITSHFCIKDSMRKTHTSGEEITIFLNTRSFLISQRLQTTQPKRKNRIAFVLLLAPSKIVSWNPATLVGVVGRPKVSRQKHQTKRAGAQQNII